MSQVYDMSLFAAPLLLGQLTDVVSGGQPAWHGYVIAVAIFVISVTGAVIENQYFNTVVRCGIHISGALVCEVCAPAPGRSVSGSPLTGQCLGPCLRRARFNNSSPPGDGGWGLGLGIPHPPPPPPGPPPSK